MRMKWLKIITAIGLFLLGTTMLVISFFAYQFHIDKNQMWGPNRIAVARLGTSFLLLAIIICSSTFFSRLLKLPFFQKTKPFFNWIKVPYHWIIESGQETIESKPSNCRTGWFAITGAIIAIIVSLWYITSGRIVTWTPSTTYFDRQAKAFLAGQLALLEKPPAALATLANPYQYQNRETIGGYIWDASYYKGNYYYYWGPVPGLMAAGVKLINPDWLIQDQYLIIFSILGLAIVFAALFYRLQKSYFPKIPGWMVMGLTLLGVLNTPVFWLVNHPDVHEVPIATGQLFLILGLYTAIIGMESKKHKVFFMTMTGFLLGAAIGSRIDLGFGIAWMVIIICLFLLLRSRKLHVSAGAIIALILPLVFWGGGLAWYNYARFGNILETGHRYQLTGGAMPADYRNILSLSYALPNLYNLLARPMEVHWREFPFFFTPFIRDTMWPKYFFHPQDLNYYYDEPITGVFISIPTNWFLLIPLIIIPLRKFWNWLTERPSTTLSIQDQPLTTWIGWMAAGAFVHNLGILSIFIYSTMRYEADLTLLLTILIALSVGWASTTFHSRPRLWKTILILVGISILISILVGLLTNFQNGDWIFKNNNPHLYQAIEYFFTGK